MVATVVVWFAQRPTSLIWLVWLVLYALQAVRAERYRRLYVEILFKVQNPLPRDYPYFTGDLDVYPREKYPSETFTPREKHSPYE